MKILFIGNSHTYFNDMPSTFALKWDEAFGTVPEVTMLAYSGRSLIWHSKEYFSIRFNLMYGNYDYCVIQQQAHPFPGYEETKEGLMPILRICRETDTVPVLYMPWAEKRFPEKQSVIKEAFIKLADEYKTMLAPIGEVWERVNQDNKVNLFWKDGEHASLFGDYLIAVTLVMAISGKTDISFLPAAYDFSGGKEINWDDLQLIEDPAETLTDLDKSVTEYLVQTVKEVLN